jgi:hypothetical protein
MGSYYKGETVAYHSISDNLQITAKYYKYSNGYFGDKGKSPKNRNREIDCDNPIIVSKNFYDSIANGGIETTLENGKGLITKLKDGTIITYREITSTANSPAVEINIKKSTNNSGIKTQKIHFEKEKK